MHLGFDRAVMLTLQGSKSQTQGQGLRGEIEPKRLTPDLTRPDLVIRPSC